MWDKEKKDSKIFSLLSIVSYMKSLLDHILRKKHDTKTRQILGEHSKGAEKTHHL